MISIKYINKVQAMSYYKISTKEANLNRSDRFDLYQPDLWRVNKS